MRLPSFSVKLRTQPTWSLRSPPSMRLVVDDVVPLVVAVEVAQHRPDALDRRVDHGGADDVLQHARAGSDLDASTRSEMALQRVEAALEHAAADRLAQLLLAPSRALELGAPFGEAARAVGHRRELQRGDVVVTPIGLSRIS